MGSGNPPDKPGFTVITLVPNDAGATDQLNAAAALGFTELLGFDNGVAILANYKKDN